MEKVLIRIHDQISGVESVSKKEVVIIYNNPVCHDQFKEYGFYKIVEYPDMWGNGIYLYSNYKVSKRLGCMLNKCDSHS